MRKIWLLAVNDLRRTAKDKAAAIWLLLLPVAMMWFFGQVGGGGGGDPQIALGIDDRDGGWLARALIEELDGDQVDLRPMGESALAAADAGGEAGEDPEPPPSAPRTLVIPAGFTAGVLAGEKQTLRLEKQPGSSTDFGFAAQVHIVRAAGRLLTRLVLLEKEGQPLVEVAPEVATDGYRRLAAEPVPVTLAVSTAGEGRQVVSGIAQSVPGMLTFIVMMMTLIYGGSFLAEERREGMLARQAGLPVSRRGLFAGKLLGRLLIAAVQVVALVAAGRFLFGVSFGSSPLGLALVLAALAFAAAGLATFLGAVLETPEQASSVGWIAGMVMAMLGGCWWPSEVMPAWLRDAAHIFPTAWAMDAFHALISFGRGLDGVLVPVAVLAGFGLLFSLLGARFLRPV